MAKPVTAKRELRASELLQHMGACGPALDYVRGCKNKSFEKTWRNASIGWRFWLLAELSSAKVMPSRVYAALWRRCWAWRRTSRSRTAELNRRMPWSRLEGYIKKLIIKLEKEGKLPA